MLNCEAYLFRRQKLAIQYFIFKHIVWGEWTYSKNKDEH